jgi:glyoxylase-like metal-dependent hydrolase (beta-lactamase superfamily II)/rhodanese-related sulfurtransferase
MEKEGRAVVFKQLNPGACRTYLVGSVSTKEAALVDPVLGHVEDYLKLLQKEGWTLRYVVDTHTHADHISGGAALTERTDAEYAMHKKSGVRSVGLRLSDGSTLPLGDVVMDVIETPGHTKVSVTVSLPGVLVTGDWLFIGGAGRTDLPGGDPAEHWESLHRVLPNFSDTDLIYPGHDYQNLSESTLGVERKSNPNLSEKSKEDYVAWMSSMAQPTPDWMIKTVRANLAGTTDPKVDWIPQDAACMSVCSPVATSSHSVPEVSTEEVRSMMKEEAAPPLLLDVREREEYVGPLGHLPGAILIPLGELPQRLSEISTHRQGTVVTICRSGNRSIAAAGILIEAGFQKVSSMAGGAEDWNQKGYPVDR